ncbi:hypothetical protein [Vineibacter terrae]|uniref:hypothetical protein n=1 Tax=Vineibacter terrae TaxID=2586908 RepID=UPI002E35860F|nr:hypothetical protein [Vineibacter terrae]HEX2891933.1 hypothetical protein [Vineibacter terrae]
MRKRTQASGQTGKAGDDAEAQKVRERQDRLLDEALKETFPASDPVSPFQIETEK